MLRAGPPPFARPRNSPKSPERLNPGSRIGAAGSKVACLYILYLLTGFTFFSGEARGPGRNLGGQMPLTSNWGYYQRNIAKLMLKIMVKESTAARAGRPAGEPKSTKSDPKGELLGAKSALPGALLGAQKGAQKCSKRVPKGSPKGSPTAPQKEPFWGPFGSPFGSLLGARNEPKWSFTKE